MNDHPFGCGCFECYQSRYRPSKVEPPASKLEMWEILVPTQILGKPIRTRYHRVWDAKIRAIAGGLTILTPTKGQWLNHDMVHEERMIPVRIACTEEQINQIIDITVSYYKQLAVMAYRVSDRVIIRNATSNLK